MFPRIWLTAACLAAILGSAPIASAQDDDDAALTPVQKRGAERFFGRANCAVCHPPPLFTDDKFHNIGTPQAGFETPHLFPANVTIRAAAEAQGWPEFAGGP